ncbi:MAG: response regulator [Spirochaetes bacterium]|nr:response regulator [Spirochaetota bacterium]
MEPRSPAYLKAAKMLHKVVIVDDNRYTADALAKTLDGELFGCEVSAVAYDGLSGKQAIISNKPDIILADIAMPGMDGL